MLNKRQLLDEYYNFWFSLNALYENWAKTKGLTVNSLMLLYMIYQHPAQSTQTFICERLSLPKQTVNTILHSFAKKGYIQMVSNPSDRRSKLLSFTPLGLSYAEPLLQELFALEEQALTQLSISEQEQWVSSSCHFCEAFTEVLKKK